MRRLLTLLPVIALALLAAWPVIYFGPPTTTSDDGLNHFYRFVELEWHIRHGDWYPRWFSDVEYGFGGPVLNFYSPLTYYIPLLLRAFILPFPAAFRLSFALAAAAAVFGAYLWAETQFESPVAALTTAAAYGLAPYFYFKLFERLSHTEVWSMALAPWVFWAALRLVRNPALKSYMVLTLLYAAFALTHNVSSLLFTPVLIVYSLASIWLAPIRPNRPRCKTLVVLALSLLHAVVMGAFFFLPFLLEVPNVQLVRAGQMFDYHGSFPETLAWPTPYDPNHVVNFYPVSLGWPQLILAAIAFGWAVFFLFRRKHDSTAWTISLIGGLLAFLVFLTFPISLLLWDAFPLSRLMQFVWRVIGPASLLAAWLSGAAIAHWSFPALQKPVGALAISSFFFFSLTWTYHDPSRPLPSYPTAIDVIRFGIASPHLAGTTTSQEFLPRWVEQLPVADTLYQRYLESEIPSRLAPLPPGVTTISEKPELKGTELIYESAQRFDAEFYTFYFPGWTASLDGQPIQIHPSSPQGTITASLPAGRHTLRLALLPTLPQIIGSSISILALAVLIALVAFRRYPAAFPASQASPRVLAPAWTMLFLSLLGLRAGLLDHVENIFWRTELNDIAHPLSVNYDDQVELIGFSFPDGDAFSGGSRIAVTLYWRAVQKLDVSYSTAVHLVDAYGNRFGHSDNYYPSGKPTTLWALDKYAHDRHLIVSPTGLPPGKYHLLVSVFHIRDDRSLTLLTMRDGDSPVGIEYDLATITITRPWPQFPGPLRLIEGSVNVKRLAVGDYLPLSVLWNSGDDPLPPLNAQLTITSLDGRLLWSINLPPAGPGYPTDQWARNELVSYPLVVTLPPDLPSGPARVQIQLLKADRSPASEIYSLGDIDVVVPERSFVIPKMDHVVDYDFSESIRLLGYTVTPEATILYWQSLRVAPKPLTVFIHRFSEGGVFVAGHDSPPPRPTTSWLPGEVLSDPHSILVGDHFEIGLYDPVTGERFGEPFVVQP
jgi:hypothetical protein